MSVDGGVSGHDCCPRCGDPLPDAGGCLDAECVILAMTEAEYTGYLVATRAGLEVFLGRAVPR